MERDTLIRIYFDNEVCTLKEKSKYIFVKQKTIAESLGKLDWFLDGIGVNLNNGEFVYATLLKSFKQFIKRNTTLKKIEDDYFDKFSNNARFTATKNYNNTYGFSYDIETKGYSIYSSNLMIDKFEIIPQMQHYSNAKVFVESLVKILPIITLEVIDRNIYTDDEQLNNKFWPGWMLYFDNSFELPELPEWVKIETLSNGGHLIITTEEVFDPENSEHKEKARSLLPLLQLKSTRV